MILTSVKDIVHNFIVVTIVNFLYYLTNVKV